MRVIERAEKEYEKMMHIMSNLGCEEIIDCLEANMDQNELKVTYGDKFLKDDGTPHPREDKMMNAEDFLCEERLDYILWLNISDLDREVTEDWQFLKSCR